MIEQDCQIILADQPSGECVWLEMSHEWQVNGKEMNHKLHRLSSRKYQSDTIYLYYLVDRS